MSGMVRRLLLLAGSLVLLLSACTGDGREVAPTPSGSPAVNAADAALLPATVDALPDIDAAGFDTLLSQLRGTPVVVNIWAAWCIPCKDEAPELAEAAERYGDDVQFLGVDVLDNRGDARTFIADYGWTYPSVFDVNRSVPTALGHTGQPVTLFYAADGTLMKSVDGPVSAASLADGIGQLLD
jgi:cytochrome c biogenesis protein CcmG/thiol:disulfide interchange protein DsbE